MCFFLLLFSPETYDEGLYFPRPSEESIAGRRLDAFRPHSLSPIPDSRNSCYTEDDDGFYSARQSLNLEASSEDDEEDEEDVKRKPLASPRGSRRSLAVRGVVNDDYDGSHSRR